MAFFIPLLISAAGAVGSFITGLGIIGKIAIGIGLNLVKGYLDKKAQEKARRESAGVQFDKQYGQNVPRQVPVGLVGMAGHDCYVNTWDKSNKWLQNLYILGDWPSGGLTDRIGINGKWYALGDVDGDRGRKVLGEWDGFVWVKDIPGSLDQKVDPYLLNNANPSQRWTDEHRGIGMAQAIVSLKYDQEKNNQFPDIFFESKGSLFYDWRKDSSVGGSGLHRWNDVKTWEPTHNPIVALYCYKRGLSVGSDLFCGMGVLPADLPLSRWTVAANLCDEAVEGEPRYEVSAIIDCGPDSTHGSNVESLLKSCGGYMIDGVEGIYPVVGSDQPIVATLTDDDVVRPFRGRFQRWRSQGELVNSIAGTHPNPENLWAMEGYAAQIATNLRVSDRRSRDIPMDFPMVRSKRQASQLAAIYLMENRLEATASQTLRPRWMGLEAGDWVRFISDHHGFDFKFMIADSGLASLDGDGPRNVKVDLQQRDGSIYSAVAKPDQLFPPMHSAPPQYLAEVQNFTAMAQVVNTGTAKYLSIRTQRDEIEDVTVVEVKFEYWPVNQPETILSKTAPVDQSVVPLVEGIVSKTEYKIRTRLVTIPPRPVPWSQPIVVMTPDQPYTDVSVELSNVQNDLRLVLQSAVTAMDEYRTNVDRVALDAALGTADNVVARQVYKKEIGTAKSLIVEETRQRVTETSALAEKTTLLQTEIADPNNGLKATSDSLFQLSNEVNNSETGLEAIAKAMLGVSAKVGDISAEGLLSFKLQVPPPNGIVAQANFLMRATLGAEWTSAGMVIQIYRDNNVFKSRILNTVDQFTIWDGKSANLPFVFEAGVLKLMVARIGKAIVELFETPSGKTRFGVLAPGVEGLEIRI